MPITLKLPSLQQPCNNTKVCLLNLAIQILIMHSHSLYG